MDAEKVWNKVKENLRFQLSRAVYETWVRDSTGVELSEDLLTVGVANSYTHDVLQEEVGQIFADELERLFDRRVEIRFVVRPEGAEDQATLSEEDALSSRIDDTVRLKTHYLSPYDEIVRPERVIVIPRYYLRWIPWLGVDLAWLPIGFRQAAFLHGCRYEAGETFEATAREVASWSGMSRAKFWRRINDPFLRWFIEPLEDESRRWRIGADQRPHRAPRQWRVTMSMPLTPADKQSLSSWFRKQLEEGADPVSVIKKAIATPVNELIPWPVEITPPQIAGEPSSVQEIMIEALGGSVDPLIEQTIYELADALANHITDPKSVLLVSHYFVEKWLPLLKSGPGWLITLLRNRCFYNTKTGELRDDIWVHGGYPELAKRLGIQRPATVAEWFRGRDTKRNKLKGEGALSIFVHELERQKRARQSVSLRFKVTMHGPLTAEDQVAYERRIKSKIDLGNNGRIARGGDANEAHKRMGSSAHETHRKGGNSANEAHRNGGGNANETHKVGGNDANETVLKDSFNTVLTTDKDKIINTTTAATSRSKGGNSDAKKVVVCLSWNLATLLSHSRVNKGVARTLIEIDATAEAYVSWLLYGASPRGASIRNTVSHTLSRLKQNPIAGAGAAFDSLAALPPADIANLILRELQGTARWSGNKEWGRAMGGADPDRLRDLVDQLGLDSGGGMGK